jgi:hypothetical protein
MPLIMVPLTLTAIMNMKVSLGRARSFLEVIC